MVFGFGKKGKKEKFPYRVSENNFEVDASGVCSFEDMHRLFNGPQAVSRKMTATTYALSENRNVTVLQSGDGVMFFYNERVDQWANQKGENGRAEDLLRDRPELGKDVIAVTMDSGTFASYLQSKKNGLNGHAEVADFALKNHKEHEHIKPVTVDQVNKTIGIPNLSEVSEAYAQGSIAYLREQRLSEYDANKGLGKPKDKKSQEVPSLKNATISIGNLSGNEPDR